MSEILSILQGSEGSRDEKIDALERAMLAQPADLRADFQPEIVDHFAPGLYAREMRIRRGACITSRVHKHEGLAILSRGSMLLYLEDGSTQRIDAGWHFVAPPGTRRVAVVLEDAVFTCFHVTELTDTDAIRDEFTSPTRETYLAWAAEQTQLAAPAAEGEKP